jgi:hypothetical protein
MCEGSSNNTLTIKTKKKKERKRAIRSGGLGKGISHECINLVLDNYIGI